MANDRNVEGDRRDVAANPDVAANRKGSERLEYHAAGSERLEHDAADESERGSHRRGHVVDREHQRDEYGGFNFGAAFFGWLVAIGVAVLLTALLSAAGAAIGLTELSDSEASESADTISIVGGVLLLLVLVIAYYAGGYVAGRMSRFDGARQGIGVWVLGLLMTILLAVIGAIAGSEYNVLGQLNLPRIPIDEGSLATGAIIALIAAVVLTLVAAALGGKAGERYHRKVDDAGLRHTPRREPAERSPEASSG